MDNINSLIVGMMLGVVGAITFGTNHQHIDANLNNTTFDSGEFTQLSKVEQYIIIAAYVADVPADRLAAHLSVESNMRHFHNEDIIKGDSGMAVGIAQIWPIAQKDVNQHYKTQYSRKKLFENIMIAALYLRLQVEKYGATTWKMASFQFNAGPNKKFHQNRYVVKIENAINNFTRLNGLYINS